MSPFSLLTTNFLLLVLVFAMLPDGNARSRTRTEIVKDTSLMYSDDGNILQMSYAEKAVRKSSSVIGFTYKRMGIILSRVQIRSKLILHNPKLNYNTIDVGNLVAVFTGLSGDVKFLLRNANVLAQSHRVNYGETISSVELARDLSRYLTLSLHPR